MESMRRSEANSSHHPNKVAVNSLATESNKHSSGSGSLNNNKLSFNQQATQVQQQQKQNQSKEQQQQQQKKSSSSESSSTSSTTSSSSSSGASTSSESKDTNFEYDDNEWDVGGIGDLIIDLDADIEKSSSTAASSNQQQTQSQQLSTAISSVGSNSGGGGGGSNNQILNADEKSPSSASSSSSSSSSPTTVSSSKSSLSSLFVPIPLRQGQQPQQQHTNPQKQRSSTSPASFSSSSKLSSKLGTKSSPNLKLQQPALLAQLNSKSRASTDHQRFSTSASTAQSSSNPVSRNLQNSSTTNHAVLVDRHNKLLSTTASMSSQPSGGQGAGKTATKMSIDHQATLDKGLKMKIKRTKPGTKTSEAKHEIVKAEQNGTSSSIEDNNIASSNSSSSNGKKHSQITTTPTVQPIQQAQQATKRGSSGHRRDKTRDKTPHSRDKSEHSSGGSGNSSSSSSSSSSSNTNSTSTADRSTSSCNCSHDSQVNGVQMPCTNVSCARNRTLAGSIDSTNTALAQRISASSGANQTTNPNNSVSGNPVSNSSSSSSNNTNSTSPFTASNSSCNTQTPGNGTPNAPGPPKEGKLSSSSGVCSSVNHQQQQSSQQISNSSISSVQQQNQTSLGSSSVLHNNSPTVASVNSSQSSSISATVHHTISVAASAATCNDGSCSPPAKRPKCDSKDMVDICVGTSVGTITEPDCLGPCEPGTSVTLEGIVWHETEGGVLVVNVTWRGKTYVGTLLDCTRHDWAPPRFCDSPTEELDSRTPKGRGKRGRSAALTPDLSNFTETRSSVHSKLRNGGAKGRGGRAVSTTGTTSTTTTNTTTTAASTNSSSNSSSTTSSNTPSTSPTAFLPPRPEKRKSKDESPSPVNGESSSQPTQTQSLVNPITGLNVQISTKKCKTASPCAISPVLLECPEQDCSKKYKHANGLRYHQSHAHGSGSMDEDSLQLPESPRVPPPTTPSPAPATTPQPQVSASNCSSTDVTTIVAAPTVPSPSLISVSSAPAQQTVPLTGTGGLLPTAGGLLPANQPAVSSVTQSSSGQTTSIPSQIPQHPIPGGSITAGVSGQALSQHQQHSMLVGTVPGSSIMAGSNQTIPDSIQPPPIPQQQQQMLVANSNITAAPSRIEPQSKIKPSVLRFGSPSDNVSSNQNPLPGQGPIRPTPTAAMAPNPGPPSTPESAHQPSYSQSPSSVQQGLSSSKPQGYVKQKKNRSKSPVSGDYDNSTSRDNVQSPAYSDISDDSTPVVDSEINDKSQSAKHPDPKKSQEGAPPQMASLGGYSMYQFYSQQQYMVPPEHQSSKSTASQSSLPPSSAEYTKSKDPPLDLITKPVQSNEPPPKESNIIPAHGPSGPLPQNPNKPMPHFYPYNFHPSYMASGYPYNMDPNYGPISMVSEENKIGAVSNAPHSMKEERNKESPSPNEHGKLPGQLMSSKLMKNESSVKEIKTESNHPMHPKESSVQSMGSYPGMYQRHTMGIPPQPPQHMSSREDDVRRYYMYADQRRPNPSSNSSSNVPPVSIKEESPSSQISMQHPSSGMSQNQQMSQMPQLSQNQSQPTQSQNSQQQQKSVKSSLSGSQTSSNQKATNLIKDIKEEKEVKIKQEGQKPTMETQGPPPPPTSQYFLHPQYLSPSFGFDPGHPVYRNVLMSTAPYNAPPYHLPLPRFHAPEDLSRNPGPKALDVLQQAANNIQYYGSHKIHELSERALKSPNSNVKVSVSSPNVSQQSGSNTVSGSNIGGGGPGILPSSGPPGGPLNLQPPTVSMPPGIGGGGGVSIGPQKGDGKPGQDPSGKPGIGGSGADSRSPPPQRHVHTHHHTHVGLGYPMYTAPYGAAVLASQQAAAVAVINPFPPAPTK